tara:strand:+ start:18289 stop:18747 length:459 start_codon:yes stop_codon:yes gene_type:complete
MVHRLDIKEQFNSLLKSGEIGEAAKLVVSGKIGKEGAERIIEQLGKRKDNLLKQTMETNHAFREACDKLGVDYSAKHVTGESKDGNKFDVLLTKGDIGGAVKLVVNGKVGKEGAEQIIELLGKRNDNLLKQTIETNHAFREFCDNNNIDYSK